VFGPGRDDWDAGERLFPAGSDDAGRPDFDFSAAPFSAPADSRLLDQIGVGLEPEGSALVRPYAVTGGRTKPRYQLQIEAMVAASHYEARDLSVLSPECQAILGFCRDWRSVAEISAVLRMPLGVARVLIADMAMEGLVRVHQIDHAQGRPDINLLERVLSGLRKL
jgi:Protein of unknown function (DUF742)